MTLPPWTQYDTTPATPTWLDRLAIVVILAALAVACAVWFVVGGTAMLIGDLLVKRDRARIIDRLIRAPLR